MKNLIIGLLSCLSLEVNAQEMKTPESAISQLFIACDQRDWKTLETIFAEQVSLDYSSMNGNPAAILSPLEIITAWRGILPGFQFTHHQIGNFQVKIQGNKAEVFCYGTASHYLEDEAGNLWWVVGSYNFELSKNEKDAWEVKLMKFNYKYQDGNVALAAKAMQNVNENK